MGAKRRGLTSRCRCPRICPGGVVEGLEIDRRGVSECVRDEKETIEVRYYISSLGGREAVRPRRPQPLDIENTCHWSLDVTYREENHASESNICERTLPGSIASHSRC